LICCNSCHVCQIEIRNRFFWQLSATATKTEVACLRVKGRTSKTQQAELTHENVFHLSTRYMTQYHILIVVNVCVCLCTSYVFISSFAKKTVKCIMLQCNACQMNKGSSVFGKSARVTEMLHPC